MRKNYIIFNGQNGSKYKTIKFDVFLQLVVDALQAAAAAVFAVCVVVRGVDVGAAIAAGSGAAIAVL